jgi:hypothetical protein
VIADLQRPKRGDSHPGYCAHIGIGFVTSISTSARRLHRSFKAAKQTPSLIGGARVTTLSGGVEMFSFAER